MKYYIKTEIVHDINKATYCSGSCSTWLKRKVVMEQQLPKARAGSRGEGGGAEPCPYLWQVWWQVMLSLPLIFLSLTKTWKITWNFNSCLLSLSESIQLYINFLLLHFMRAYKNLWIPVWYDLEKYVHTFKENEKCDKTVVFNLYYTAWWMGSSSTRIYKYCMLTWLLKMFIVLLYLVKSTGPIRKRRKNHSE